MKINITPVAQSKINEVDMKHLIFGDVFSDYMLIMDYKNGQWQAPQIVL